MLRKIFDAISSAGGKPYLVGGFVRDYVIRRTFNIPIETKDIDSEVFGLSPEQLVAVLQPFGKVDEVGKSFGVIKLTTPDGCDYDFNLPRRDSKVGGGHKDFVITIDPNISVEEAAGRRDFTMNSLLMDKDLNVIDYYGGQTDIALKILKPTTEAFVEDALRVLRAFQFSARFDMTGSIGLILDAVEMKKEYSNLAKERIFEEWKKWCLRGKYYSKSLTLLKEMCWSSLYPELDAIYNVPQDCKWHPEGWSNIISINSGLASSTISETINNGISLRKFISSSVASFAATKSVSRTSWAHFVDVINKSGDILSANNTGFFGFNFSSRFVETINAQSMSFMFSCGRTARTTDKRFRIVFPISISCMNSIMGSAVNDLEIVKRIISPVSIYMMNMFARSQTSTQIDFHDISMEPQTSSIFNDNFHVFADVVDFSCESVYGNIVFSVDFCFNSEFWEHIVNPYFVHKNVTYDIIHQIPTMNISMGNVITHTGFVLEAMAEICERENITGEDRLVLIFSALGHDFGKATHTYVKENGEIGSKGHEAASGPLVRSFLESIGCPESIIQKVVVLVVNHMLWMKMSDKHIRKVAAKLADAKTNFKMLTYLLEADRSGRPPLEKGLTEGQIINRQRAIELGCWEDKPVAIIRGQDVIDIGYKPGPIVGKIVKKLYEMQLNGSFSDKESGLGRIKSFVASL